MRRQVLFLAMWLAPAGGVPYCAEEPGIERASVWDVAPLVVVCATSPAPRDQVERAVGWWAERGAAIDGVVSSPCLGAPCHPGTIRIDLQDQAHADLGALAAATLYHRPGDDRVACARVDLSGPVSDLALVHEIGHTLGWGHARTDGHVMSPTLADGGWGADGVCPGPARQESSDAP